MASVQGTNDKIELSSDGGSTWKFVICETSNTFNFTRNTTRTPTKCDGGTSALSIGTYEWSFNAGIVVDTAPTAGQCSYEELLSWAQAGTSLLLRNQNDATGVNYYHSGTVYITSLTKTSEAEGLVSAEIEFSGDGVLDYIA